MFLARAVGVAVGRRSGGRLATTLVATKNIFIFFIYFFFSEIKISLVLYWHERSALQSVAVQAVDWQRR